jgi:hypothetical protein
VKNRYGESSSIVVYEAECVTDVIALPAFVTIVDFANISAEDREFLLWFWNDTEEGLSEETVEQLIADGELDKEDLLVSEDPVFAIHYEEVAGERTPACIRHYEEIALLEDRLRIVILNQQLTCLQAYISDGKKQRQINSEKTYRLLAMYKHLRDHGSLSQEDFERLSREDSVSRSTFYRDMFAIRIIESGNLDYDRKEKKYVLRHQKNKIKGV